MAHRWSRLFAGSGFRWQMGLGSGDLDSFFAPTEDSTEILAERRRCLDQSPADYAALLEAGRPLVQEMSQLPAIARVADPFTGDLLGSLGRNLEPDFVVLLPSIDGPLVVGGVVCFPSSWSLPEKIGLTLDQTHGPVPALNSQLAERIRTALNRLPPGVAWERENWGLSRDAERNHHPHRNRRRLDETVEPEEVWLRVEHQLLYRLPQTSGILFGIRLEITPWREVLQDEEAKADLHRALQTMPPDTASYKGLLSVRSRLLTWLTV